MSQQAIQVNEILKCIKCGRDIAAQVRAKEAKELISGDLLCEECRAKQEREKAALPEEKVECWGCGKDLKPENIFIRKDEKGKFIAKIGDFGLSRSYVIHGGTITRPEEWAGTPFYMPPEQITNFKNVKPHTDVYAMGVTLYHLITGKFPYDFPTRKQLLEMLSMGKAEEFKKAIEEYAK